MGQFFGMVKSCGQPSIPLWRFILILQKKACFVDTCPLHHSSAMCHDVMVPMQEYVDALNDIVAEGSQNVTDTLLVFVLGGKNCAVCLRPIMKSGITVESSLGPVIVCDQSRDVRAASA